MGTGSFEVALDIDIALRMTNLRSRKATGAVVMSNHRSGRRD